MRHQADFGIAKHLTVDLSRTTNGEVLPTPHYLSPEAVCGAPPAPQQDIYSPGVMFYELLCGKRPYDAASVNTLLGLHIHAGVPQRPPALALLQPLIDSMMAKSPEHRIQSAQELLDTLPMFVPACASEAGGPIYTVGTAGDTGEQPGALRQPLRRTAAPPAASAHALQ